MRKHTGKHHGWIANRNGAHMCAHLGKQWLNSMGTRSCFCASGLHDQQSFTDWAAALVGLWRPEPSPAAFTRVTSAAFAADATRLAPLRAPSIDLDVGSARPRRAQPGISFIEAWESSRSPWFKGIVNQI
jgi:hypothetical protein